MSAVVAVVKPLLIQIATHPAVKNLVLAFMNLLRINSLHHKHDYVLCD